MQKTLNQLQCQNNSLAYQALKELEALSETDNALYAHFDFLLSMLKSAEPNAQLRGFRLICKQAKWDTENKLDRAIDALLGALDTPRPTLLRQELKALTELAQYKPALGASILRHTAQIDLSKYGDSMQPLLLKDLQALSAQINAAI